MTRLSCLVAAVAIAAIAPPAALSAQGFEGVIQQEVKQAMPQGVASLAGADTTDPSAVLSAVLAKLPTAQASAVNTAVATVHVKGTRLRTDGALAAQGAPDGYAILDAGKSTLYTVFPAQKTVMFATADAMVKLRQLQGQAPAAAPAPTRVDLGTKVLNGVHAHGYRLTTPDAVAIIWVDPAMKGALDAFEALQQKMAGPAAGNLQSAAAGLGFPVLQQVVMKAPAVLGSGWLFSQVTVKSVKKEPVPDTQFTLPTDYNQVDLAQRLGNQ